MGAAVLSTGLQVVGNCCIECGGDDNIANERATSK